MSASSLLDELLGEESVEDQLSIHTEEEDLLSQLLFDANDGCDIESLSGSEVALLESESLGSLKELIKPTSAKKKEDSSQVTPKVPLPVEPLQISQEPHPKESAEKNKDETNKTKTSSPNIMALESDSPLPAMKPESDIFVIDTHPDETLDQVTDLREILNSKRRKRSISPIKYTDPSQSYHPTKISQTVVLHNPHPQSDNHVRTPDDCIRTPVNSGKSLFPAMSAYMPLQARPKVFPSIEPQFSLHHLFGKRTSWQFSLDHL